LNSPETPVCSKGKTLYGLNWAKPQIVREERALVVEGYFDLIRLASAGIQSVVAPLGTALTEAQATLLRRVPNVFLLYDNDKAGLKATFRSGDALLRQGLSVRVASLPPGEDPDSFAKKHGAAGIEKALSESVDVFDRKIQLLERGGWFGDLHKTRRALDRLLPTLRATSDVITRDLYLKRVSEVSGVARKVLENELGLREPTQATSSGADQPREQTKHAPTIFPRNKDLKQVPLERGGSAERELIRVMLTSPAQVEMVSERLSRDDFLNKHFRSIYDALLLAGNNSTLEALSSNLEEGAIQAIEELLADAEGYVHPQQTVSDSLSGLRARDLEKELADLDRLTPLAGPDQKDELLLKKVALAHELRATGSLRFKVF